MDCHRTNVPRGARYTFPRWVSQATLEGRGQVFFNLGPQRVGNNPLWLLAPDGHSANTLLDVRFCRVSEGGRACSGRTVEQGVVVQSPPLSKPVQYDSDTGSWEIQPTFQYQTNTTARPGVYGYKFWLAHNDRDRHAALDFAGEPAQFGGTNYWYYAWETTENPPFDPTKPLNDGFLCPIELAANQVNDRSVSTEARKFRDDVLLQSRLGFLVAKKYYELAPDVARFLLKHPKHSGKMIDTVRRAMATTEKFMKIAQGRVSELGFSEPVISPERAARIRSFMNQIEAFQDLSPNFKRHLTALKTLLVLLAMPSPLNPNGGDYLTFGDLIRMVGGQIEQMQSLPNQAWLHYAHHLHRKPNPHLVARLSEFVGEVFAVNPEEALAIAIRRPMLMVQLTEMLDGSTARLATDEDLKGWLTEIQTLAEDPAFIAAVEAFKKNL